MNTIRVRMSLGLSMAKDGDVLSRGEAVITGMTGNPAYPTPPVALSALKTALDSLSATASVALDGSKQAIAEKNQQAEAVLTMLRQLGHYAEAACNNDPVVFTSSGFVAALPNRVPAQPLPPAGINKIVQGNSGQLLVLVKPLPKARNYELRYSVAASGGASISWTTETITHARPASPINGLTPGTTYTFQVRALGKLGFTEWSDPVIRMTT